MLQHIMKDRHSDCTHFKRHSNLVIHLPPRGKLLSIHLHAPLVLRILCCAIVFLVALGLHVG